MMAARECVFQCLVLDEEVFPVVERLIQPISITFGQRKATLEYLSRGFHETTPVMCRVTVKGLTSAAYRRARAGAIRRYMSGEDFDCTLDLTGPLALDIVGRDDRMLSVVEASESEFEADESLMAAE